MRVPRAKQYREEKHYQRSSWPWCGVAVVAMDITVLEVLDWIDW